MVYYKHNEQIYAYDNEEAYENYGRYDADGNDKGMVSITLEEVEAMQEAGEVAQEASLSVSERIYGLEGLIKSLTNIEAKNPKYFHGAGFSHGMESVRRFSHHPDTNKLLTWEQRMWTQAETWVKAIETAPTDAATSFTTVFFAENLPKIDVDEA